MKKIYVILFIFGFPLLLMSQRFSIVELNEYSFNFKGNSIQGNVFLPLWSPDGNKVSVDFSGLDVTSIGIVDISNNVGQLITAETREQRQGPIIKPSRRGNTWNSIWAPHNTQLIYVLSSLNNIIQLYELELDDNFKVIRTSNISSQQGTLRNMHLMNPVLLDTPPTRFSKSKNCDLFFAFGTERQNDMGKFRINTLDNKPIYEQITNSPKKNEVAITGMLDGDNQMHYVMTVYQGNGSILEYSNDYKTWSSITTEENIFFISPRFSPSGNKLAYLKSEKLLKGHGVNMAVLLFSLWIYDFELDQHRQIHYPVYLENQKAHQNNYDWIDDQTLIYIDASSDYQPLMISDINTGQKHKVETSTVHHFDLAFNQDNGYLAFTAKGSKDSDEYSYSKLFVGRLLKR